MTTRHRHVETADTATHALRHHISYPLLSCFHGTSDGFIADGGIGIHHLHHFIICLRSTGFTVREERLTLTPIDGIIDIESIPWCEKDCSFFSFPQEVTIHIGLATQFVSGRPRRDEVTTCHTLQVSFETTPFLISMITAPVVATGCHRTTEIGRHTSNLHKANAFTTELSLQHGT